MNDASSYLDLAPLYGGTQEAQNSIRTFQDGLLKPDTFADKRLIGNPPGVVIILIMFNRFHNHVASHLAAINEGGRFTKPQGDPSDEKVIEAWKKYDDDLFQTARLVTSGLYINITLIDYVRNIVNLNRVDSAWTLDPRQEMGTQVGTKSGSEAGVGNAVSAEFNLCYRWHSCISEQDDKWIQDFFVELLGENYGEMNLQTLIGAMKKFEASIADEPSERTFGGFTRGPDGMFSDDDLVNCLATAIEQPGGAFGARNVPRIMKPIEMLGIIRGRKWNLAGLNEFRKHFGMKAYATFEDINSDPAVAEALRNLYQHPDYVELYPGIVAEEAKTPMVPGVGIAPTYTISRVVLSDAVSLVRGDRYYTTDYHPGNLTNWGYKEVEYDFNINHGCVFYKLFNRAFPNHFKSDSVYSHYPMVTPSENLKILKNLKRDQLFSFDRPAFRGQSIAVTSYATAKHMLSSELKYPVDWQQGLERLMSAGSNRLTLPGDAQLQAKHRKVMSEHLYKDGWRQAVGNFYSETLDSLLKEKSYEIAGHKQVDVVRDIGNIVHTHFIARLFNLPLKTKANPRGVFTEQELYQALAAILTSVCFDTDTVKSFPLRREAKAAAEQLIAAAETNVKLSLSFGLKGLFTKQPKSDPMGLYGVNLIKALAKDGLNAYDIAWGQIVPIASAMVPHQAQFVSHFLPIRQYLCSLLPGTNVKSVRASSRLVPLPSRRKIPPGATPRRGPPAKRAFRLASPRLRHGRHPPLRCRRPLPSSRHRRHHRRQRWPLHRPPARNARLPEPRTRGPRLGLLPRSAHRGPEAVSRLLRVFRRRAVRCVDEGCQPGRARRAVPRHVQEEEHPQGTWATGHAEEGARGGRCVGLHDRGLGFSVQVPNYDEGDVGRRQGGGCSAQRKPRMRLMWLI